MRACRREAEPSRFGALTAASSSTCRRNGTLIAVPVKTSRDFEMGPAVALFKTRTSKFVDLPDPLSRNGYAVFNNGQRFLINQPPQSPSEVPITVVVNWVAGMPRA